MKKKIIIGLIIALSLIAIRFCISGITQMLMKKHKAGAVTPVSITEIQNADVQMEVEAPGRVISDRRVDVVSRISGYLTKSYFKEGDFVKKGQVLFEIEPQEYANALQEARANVEDTRAKLKYAEKNAQRSETLLKKQYISKDSYDQLISVRDGLRAQLKLYTAKLRDAERNYSYTHVKAPVDGRVGMMEITVGNYVTKDSGSITTVYSVDPIYVTFPVAAKTFQILQEVDEKAQNVGRKTELILANGEKYKFEGIQDFQNNIIEETTGSIMLRAVFKNPNGLLINGDYVKVKIFSNNKTTVPVVPQTAVMENPKGKYVYKIDEKGLPQICFITVEGQYKDNWIVTSGLVKGDKIITGNIQKVIPDTPVKIVSEEELKVEKKDNEK